MLENGWIRIILGSALFGTAFYCVSYFFFARVKDSMDGIRAVYLRLFSMVLSVVVCILSCIVYGFLKTR